MLSEKSLKIVGCTQDEQGYWMPDNDGDFDYITEEHIIGVLVNYVLGKGCTMWSATGVYMIELGDIFVCKSNMLTALDEAVQAVN